MDRAQTITLYTGDGEVYYSIKNILRLVGMRVDWVEAFSWERVDQSSVQILNIVANTIVRTNWVEVG